MEAAAAKRQAEKDAAAAKKVRDLWWDLLRKRQQTVGRRVGTGLATALDSPLI